MLEENMNRESKDVCSGFKVKDRTENTKGKVNFRVITKLRSMNPRFYGDIEIVFSG